MSIAEPASVVMLSEPRKICFSCNPLVVMFTPLGSIHEKPSGLRPYGINIPAPDDASTAATDVKLPDFNVTGAVIGIGRVLRDTGSVGESTAGVLEAESNCPSQPSWIEPSGAWTTPPWMIRDAKNPMFPATDVGAAAVPVLPIVIEP